MCRTHCAVGKGLVCFTSAIQGFLDHTIHPMPARKKSYGTTGTATESQCLGSLLYPREETQDEQGEDGPKHGRGLTPHTRRAAHRRRQPEAGGGRQTLNLLIRLALEDCPGSKKSHPGNDTLNDTAQIRDGHPRLVGDHDKEGGPEGHEHMGPETRRFADSLTLEAHQTTEQCCQQHAQHDLGDLRYPWPVSYTHLTLPTILRV